MALTCKYGYMSYLFRAPIFYCLIPTKQPTIPLVLL